MLKKCLAALLVFLSGFLGAQEAPAVNYVERYSCAVWSQDSDFILAGTADGGLRLWDVWQKREALSVDAHNAAVRSVAFTPGGGLVSASDDGSLRIWDAATGRLLREIKAHNGAVLSVAASPDGGNLYSAGADNTVRVWDAATGRSVRVLSGHTGAVNSVSLDAAGSLLCSASSDGSIKLWDAASGRLLRTLAGHAGGVNSAAVNGAGTMVFSGGADKTTRLWDAAAGRELNRFAVKQIPLSVAFSADGKNMTAVLEKDEESSTGIEIYSISEEYPAGNRDTSLMYWFHNTLFTAFDSGGKYLLICNGHGYIEVQPVFSGDFFQTELLLTRLDYIEALAAAKDGRVFAGSEDSSVKVWDAAKGRQSMFLRGHYAGISSLALSPDENTLLSGSKDQTIKVWDTANGREQKTLTGMRSWVRFLDFSPDGKRVFSWDMTQFQYGHEKNIIMWDTETWKPRGVALYDSRYMLNALFLEPSGKNLFTSDAYSILKILDGSTGEALHSFEGTENYSNFSVSPDGEKTAFTFSKNRENYVAVYDAKRFFSGSFEGKLWEAVIPAEYSTSFSPDGKLLVCSGRDNLKIFDAAAGGQVLSVDYVSSLPGFSNFNLRSALFTPDGKKIVAIIERGVLGIFDTNGRELARLIGFYDGEWICVTPQGYYSASPKGDSYVRAALGGKALSLAEYRSRYNKPERVEALLAGK